MRNVFRYKCYGVVTIGKTEYKNDTVSKSWFAVFDNPQDHDYEGEPQEVVDRLANEWVGESLTRTCAVTFCVSEKGLRHCHAVFEDTKAMRFSKVKKTYPGMHLEPTKGNKLQAADYIFKRGAFEDKSEKILAYAMRGEIRGMQGGRSDLEEIEQLIEQGFTPNDIFSTNFAFRRYEKMIRDAFFQKRADETPVKRDVQVIWHVGDSGTGKSHSLLALVDTHGEDEVYIVSDYMNGFDKYNGEKLLFMDEFRGQLRYAELLSITDGYKVQIRCRYANIFALWVEVHITSVLPPEMVYRNMVNNHLEFDTYQQLRRRIDIVVYHYIHSGEHKIFEQPMSEYIDYATLRMLAMSGEFVDVSDDEDIQTVFNEMP